MATAQEIVGTQGLFEIRVQTTGNESEHVLYGDQITSVGVPQKDYDGRWGGVAFSLTDAGAEAFRKAAIESGAVNNPDAHNLVMILDNETVYSAPPLRRTCGTTPDGPGQVALREHRHRRRRA